MATDIDWEDTLPKFLEQDTYAENAIDNLISTDMNGGPFKSRPRSTEAYQVLNGTMVLSSEQRSTFYTFYRSTIKWGALSFNFPEPGVITETIETKITSASMVPINGSHWRLTLKLTVLVTE